MSWLMDPIAEIRIARRKNQVREAFWLQFGCILVVMMITVINLKERRHSLRSLQQTPMTMMNNEEQFCRTDNIVLSVNLKIAVACLRPPECNCFTWQ